MNKDSYWVKMDDGEFEKRDRLLSREWRWLRINSYELLAGEHTLTFAYREKATKLDKIWISDGEFAPSGMGRNAESCVPVVSTEFINQTKARSAYSLSQNYPNPFFDKTTISFEIPEETQVSIKVFNMLGVEIVELAGNQFNPGTHSLEFNSTKLPEGNYFYTFKADKHSITRKMIVLTQQ